MASPFWWLIVPAMSLLTHIVHQLLKEKPFCLLPNSMFSGLTAEHTDASENIYYGGLAGRISRPSLIASMKGRGLC